jgi:hypothetical protein
MFDSFLNDKILSSDWIVFLGIAVLLSLATELGFRFGRCRTPERRKAFQGQSSSLQGALLGLLGLLLGFTFAMAVSRFEARKQLALDEANGIGTVWLRAGLLSDSTRDVIRPTLVDYIDCRLQGAAATAHPGSEDFRQQLARSEQDQAMLWRATVAEVKANNTPSTSLFTASLNDLIDLDGKRQAAWRNHVPSTVWLLLLVVSFTVCWTTGYASGLGNSQRHALSMIVLPALLSVVITIIVDLDNPQRGLIKVSQQSMIDLQNTLKKYR